MWRYYTSYPYMFHYIEIFHFWRHCIFFAESEFFSLHGLLLWRCFLRSLPQPFVCYRRSTWKVSLPIATIAMEQYNAICTQLEDIYVLTIRLEMRRCLLRHFLHMCATLSLLLWRSTSTWWTKRKHPRSLPLMLLWGCQSTTVWTDY